MLSNSPASHLSARYYCTLQLVARSNFADLSVFASDWDKGFHMPLKACVYRKKGFFILGVSG